jgi:translocation and assembly module TamB
LTGNILNPNILGRVETQDGQVYYRDRTFEILSASFENFDPSRLNPVIDLRSKTKVKNYSIYLSIHGTKDKMYPSLSSEPSLPTVDIINLLTLGKERTSYYERSEESLLGVGLSSLLLGPVFGGIEEGAEQLFGFDRFRIDPFLVGNKSNPTARLTVGKRITKDLTLIYSTNITQSREDVLILEYRLSNNIILVASRNEYGAYGVDVQFESNF